MSAPDILTVPRTAPPPDSAVNGLDGFTHRYAEVNGTRLHYVVSGRGPAVMLLHGFLYSWEAWRAVMPRLAEAGYAKLAPDLRGMGDSAPAASDTFAKGLADKERAAGLPQAVEIFDCAL